MVIPILRFLFWIHVTEFLGWTVREGVKDYVMGWMFREGKKPRVSRCSRIVSHIMLFLTVDGCGELKTVKTRKLCCSEVLLALRSKFRFGSGPFNPDRSACSSGSCIVSSFYAPVDNGSSDGVSKRGT